MALNENVILNNKDEKNKEFAENLLKLGTGLSGRFDFPDNFGVSVKSRGELINNIYKDINENSNNCCYFRDRVIVSPTNASVDNVNQDIYNRLSGKEMAYLSQDKSIKSEEGMDIQTSVYNRIDSPSIPPHDLKLKIGCTAMIIRNLRPSETCNGTRAMVINFDKNIIVGKILSGVAEDE